MTLKLGIDDAGRGPVIGPMVLAGCVINEEIEAQFREMGVKDSKQVAPKKRKELAAKIKELALSYKIVIISPEVIDVNQSIGVKLNETEAIATAQIIDGLNENKDVIHTVVDCPSAGIKSWQDYLITQIKNMSNIDLSCEHKADVNHISAAAGSILAKETREEQMAILNSEYNNEMGSGYPSDPKTKEFLAKYARTYADKGIFRKCWSTWQKAYEKDAQQTL